MWPDRVSNPGHVDHYSDALPTPNEQLFPKLVAIQLSYLKTSAMSILKLQNITKQGAEWAAIIEVIKCLCNKLREGRGRG